MSSSPPADSKWSRKHVTDIIGNNHKVVSPNGVEDLTGIPENGITEWLSIRGRNKANPVLLFIHGGPGSPTTPAACSGAVPYPVVMFCGRHGYATSHTVVPPWLDGLQVPKKKLIFFEESAHMMMIEQPGLFSHRLISDVLPRA